MITINSLKNFYIESWKDHPSFKKREISIAKYSSIKGINLLPKVTMDSFSYMVTGHLMCTKIGRYCSFGENVQIGRQNHNISQFSSSPFFTGKAASINSSLTDLDNFKINSYFNEGRPRITDIGNDVWIGHGVIVNAGIKIGHGAVLAAGSVVTKDVPDYAIIGGNPGKIIRYRFDDETIESLINTSWWDYPPWEIGKVSFNDIKEFIKKFSDSNETLKRYNTEFFDEESIINS